VSLRDLPHHQRQIIMGAGRGLGPPKNFENFFI